MGAETSGDREPSRAAEEQKYGVLTMTSEREGEVHVVALSGEIDLSNASEVDEELKRVEATDADAIIVDLTGVEFIDSTGIRLLVTVDARSRADANRVSLVRPPPRVFRILEISGIADRLPFAD